MPKLKKRVSKIVPVFLMIFFVFSTFSPTFAQVSYDPQTIDSPYYTPDPIAPTLYTTEDTVAVDWWNDVINKDVREWIPGDQGEDLNWKEALTGWVCNRLLYTDENTENMAKSGCDFNAITIYFLTALIQGSDCSLKMREGDGGSPNDASTYVCTVPEWEKTAAKGGVGAGIIGNTARVFNPIVNNPPIPDTYAYVKKTLANNILNPQPAYAQDKGTFESVLSITEQFWRTFRDIALSLSLLVMVAIGFMIMLSDFPGINMKTKVNLVSALPQVFVSLLLIVFSFLIPLIIIQTVMALGDALFIALLRESNINSISIITAQSGTINLVYVLGASIIPAFSGLGPGMTVAGLAIGLLITMVCLYYFFKLVIILAKKYVNLLMLIMFGPLILLSGALPGRSHMITGWFKAIIGISLMFPVIRLLITLAVYIASIAIDNSNYTLGKETAFNHDPLINGVINLPVLAIAGFVGLGLLIAATKVPDYLEKIFGGPALHPLIADTLKETMKVAPAIVGGATASTVGAGSAGISSGWSTAKKTQGNVVRKSMAGISAGSKQFFTATRAPATRKIAEDLKEHPIAQRAFLATPGARSAYTLGGKLEKDRAKLRNRLFPDAENVGKLSGKLQGERDRIVRAAVETHNKNNPTESFDNSKEAIEKLHENPKIVQSIIENELHKLMKQIAEEEFGESFDRLQRAKRNYDLAGIRIARAVAAGGAGDPADIATQARNSADVAKWNNIKIVAEGSATWTKKKEYLRDTLKIKLAV